MNTSIPFQLKQTDLLSPLKRFSKIGNLGLIFAMASVLMMMIVPLSPFFLDFLLSLNMIGAITLLIVSVFIGSPLQLSSFPTLLLVATLFRLGLNIASTRLILSTGEAGEIITTFGEFATKGNLVVGGIMFMILTIIQFIVIAKGSERVAEVAARFTLDAMPGKQMSIDADLRAGQIDQNEARDLRNNLQKEAKMYGAMDGAMKFVKGDAIAGMLIIVINLVAGFIIGATSRGLTLVESIHTYSLLTIGDGLVSQIPSLLISLTAGFIVTRVADDKNKSSLGTEMGSQIFGEPKALLIAAGLSFIVGLIPGFPHLFFWALSFLLGIIGLNSITAAKRALTDPLPLEYYQTNTEQNTPGLAVPLSLEVGPELFHVFKNDSRWTHCFGPLYQKLRNHLTNQMGIVYPDIKITINSMFAQTFKYRVLIYEVPIDNGILSPHHCASIKNNENEDEDGGRTVETVHGTKLMLWDLKRQAELEQKGRKTHSPEQMLMRHLAKLLKSYSSDFLGIQETRDLLNQVETFYPELVHEVVPKLMSIQKLTDILKRLVEEGVPIKDLRLILQILSCSQPETKDPITLTETIRIGLKRTISFMHANQHLQIKAVTLDENIEDKIRSGIQKNGAECYLVLPPQELQNLITSFKSALGYQSNSVVLTTVDIRRYVRKIIEEEFPYVPVLSFQELDPRILIEPAGVVSTG